MSSESFVMTSAGKTAGQAFKRAVARALYDHGHAGYTGTIAEKDGYRLYRRPAIAKLNPFDLVEIALHPARRAGAEMSTEERRMLDKIQAETNSKHDPCAALRLTDKEAEAIPHSWMRLELKPGESLFVFFGWASS